MEIVRAASFCIHRIHKAKYIPYWGPEDAYMEYFWNMTSHIVLTVAKILLDKQLEQSREINQILVVLQEIYHERNTFLTSMDQVCVCTTTPYHTLIVFILFCSHIGISSQGMEFV